MTTQTPEEARKIAWDLLEKLDSAYNNGFGSSEADLVEEFLQKAVADERESVFKYIDKNIYEITSIDIENYLRNRGEKG